MNVELKLSSWLNSNKLALNINKTHYIIFKNKDKLDSSPNSIKIMNVNIIQVEHTKFLGVQFDSKFPWSTHVSNIKCKIAKGIGIISKAKRVLTKPTLLTLYYTFIYPYLHYCIEVWGRTYQTHLNSLIKLQTKLYALYHQQRDLLILIQFS